jgi:hypothetical protein
MLNWHRNGTQAGGYSIMAQDRPDASNPTRLLSFRKRSAFNLQVHGEEKHLSRYDDPMPIDALARYEQITDKDDVNECHCGHYRDNTNCCRRMDCEQFDRGATNQRLWADVAP